MGNYEARVLHAESARRVQLRGGPILEGSESTSWQPYRQLIVDFLRFAAS